MYGSTHESSERTQQPLVETELEDLQNNLLFPPKDHDTRGVDAVADWVHGWPAKLLLVFLMLVAFVYSACAIHYGLYQLFGPYGPLFHIGQWTWHLNDEILALATGRKFAEGPGSTTYAQKERYGRNWYFMSPHQVCGGIILFFGIFQFIPQIRKRASYRLHRIFGRIYVIAHYVNLYGSFGFLSKHTYLSAGVFPEKAATTLGGIYGGSVFMMTLWLYWLGAFTSLTLGVYTICRGHVQRHRACMALSYGFVLGAAGLRFFWGIYGWLLPQYTMAETNQAAVMWFVSSMFIVASLYTSLAHKKQYNPVDLTGLCSVLFVLALAGSVFLVSQCLLRFYYPQLDAFSWAVGGSSELNQYHTQVYQSGSANTLSAVVFVASWSIASLCGPLLIWRYLKSSHEAYGTEDGPGNWEKQNSWSWLFVLSTVVAAMSTTSLPPFKFFNFSAVLEGTSKGPEVLKGTDFYIDSGPAVWECKCALLLLKLALFMYYRRDQHRACEWLILTVGEVYFMMLFFPVVLVFQQILPTFEDAFYHAAVLVHIFTLTVSMLFANLIFAVELKPDCSALVNGLFGFTFFRSKQI